MTDNQGSKIKAGAQTPPTDRPLTAGDWTEWHGGENPVPGQKIHWRNALGTEHGPVLSDEVCGFGFPSMPGSATIIAYRLPRPATSAASEELWIEWNGGEAPIRTQNVEVKLRDGSVCSEAEGCWQHDPRPGTLDDIVAYRHVHRPEEVLPSWLRGVKEALVLAEDVLSRSPMSTQMWRTETESVHPNEGIQKVRRALAALASPPSAASGGEGWASLETAPMDGRPFYVRAQSPFRFLPYKPASQEAKRGKVGRWQTMNEYGGWENCSPPVGDWKLHPDHAAALASPPVSELVEPGDPRHPCPICSGRSAATHMVPCRPAPPVSERERELEGALAPFASEAKDWPPTVLALDQNVIVLSPLNEKKLLTRFKWSDFGRAVAALTAQPAGEGK